MPLFGPPNVEKLKAEGNIKGLIKALSYKKDESIRTAAAGALGEISDARAVEPLIATLKDKDVRKAAAEALVKIGAPAVKPLITALKDESWVVRIFATAALCDIGDARAMELLIAALKDRDKNVRKFAASRLGKMGSERAVRPLITTLTDADKDVRKAAAGALGQIGAPAVEPLIAALKDQDMCEAAVRALDTLGWQPDRSEAGAAYWAAKSQWDKCVEIGAPAVEPLIAALKGVNRRPVAQALVKLYRGGELDMWTKQKILAVRETVEQPHYDYTQSSDCGSHTDRAGVSL